MPLPRQESRAAHRSPFYFPTVIFPLFWFCLLFVFLKGKEIIKSTLGALPGSKKKGEGEQLKWEIVPDAKSALELAFRVCLDNRLVRRDSGDGLD